MSILADTNTLLRRTQPKHPSHTPAVESIAQLVGAGETSYFTLQIMSEFWNVATRPVENNGFGFSIAATLTEVQKIERFLFLLPDLPAVYAEWKRLVVKHNILGSKVHDAKLAELRH